MWVILPRSFLSIACARRLDLPGHPLDVDRLMVRARLREHLESLIERHPDLFGKASILDSWKADYRWRIVVDKADVAEVLRREAMAVDYGNFKQRVGEIEGHGSPFLRALHDIWSVMVRLQRPDPDSHRPGARRGP